MTDASTTTSEFTEPVNRGVELLDEYYGRANWLAVIDLDELQLDQCDSCVMGQILHHLGCNALGVAPGVPGDYITNWFPIVSELTGDPPAYGFDVGEVDDIDVAYAQLEHEWKATITRLRAES